MVEDNSAKIQELQSKIAAIDILLQKANVKYKELCAQEGALQEEVAAFEQEKVSPASFPSQLADIDALAADPPGQAEGRASEADEEVE